MELTPKNSSASVEIGSAENMADVLPEMREFLSIHENIVEKQANAEKNGKISKDLISSQETHRSGIGYSQAIRNERFSLTEQNGDGKVSSTQGKVSSTQGKVSSTQGKVSSTLGKVSPTQGKPEIKLDTADQATTSPPVEVPIADFDDGFGIASHQPRQSMQQRTILSVHGIILGKVIGTGNYAKVKIAYSEELGKRVAVKIISKLRAPIEYTRKFLPREIETVKGLHHENLIQFYQSIETNHRVYLVMQLAENGTLLDYVRDKKYLGEPLARELFRQLISAVSYIHSKGVVHRDIKCENLLLDVNYNLKLIDFGFARKDFREDETHVILSKTFCGSYAYASPEILKGIAYDPIMSDIWASGVVCYAMVFGRLPYDGSSLNSLLVRINSSLIFPKLPPVSTECKHLLLHILAPLSMRYTMQMIKCDQWLSTV